MQVIINNSRNQKKKEACKIVAFSANKSAVVTAIHSKLMQLNGLIA